MKAHGLVFAFLFASLFAIYLFYSGAPTRVHVAMFLTCSVSMASLFVLTWIKNISRRRRIALGVLMSLAGSLLINFGLGLTVSKFGMNFIGITAYTILLPAGFLVLHTAAILGVKFIGFVVRSLQSSKNP